MRAMNRKDDTEVPFPGVRRLVAVVALTWFVMLAVGWAAVSVAEVLVR